METKLRREYRIAIVGKGELALGLKLSGIREAYAVESGEESESLMRTLLQRDDIGLIIITLEIVRGIRDKRILSAIESSILPMVIEVPGYREEQVPDTLRRLIVRAIGIDISKSIGG